MIFNLQAGEVKTLPILSDKYPEDITVKQGENAVFSAVIDEDGIPTEYTYQWYVNDSIVSDANTAVYTRKTDSDNGAYTVYCEITNKAGTVKTRTAKLEVNTLPKLDSSKLTDATITLGETKTLEVSVSEHGYPKTYTYQWYLNDSPISGATVSIYDYKPTSHGKATLYCKVTNSAGTVTSSTVTIKTRLYLFNSGDECVSVTGGWSGTDYKYVSGISTYPGTVESTYLQSIAYGKRGVMGTKKNIDLSNFETLFVNGRTTYAGSVSAVFVSTKKDDLLNYVAARGNLAESSSVQTTSIDIKKLSGKFYICFGSRHNEGGDTTFSRVTKMWLE